MGSVLIFDGLLLFDRGVAGIKSVILCVRWPRKTRKQWLSSRLKRQIPYSKPGYLDFGMDEIRWHGTSNDGCVKGLF